MAFGDIILGPSGSGIILRSGGGGIAIQSTTVTISWGTPSLATQIKPLSLTVPVNVGAISITPTVDVGMILVDPGSGITLGPSGTVTTGVQLTSLTFAVTVGAPIVIREIDNPVSTTVGVTFGAHKLALQLTATSVNVGVIVSGVAIAIPAPPPVTAGPELIRSVQADWEVIKVIAKTVNPNANWLTGITVNSVTYSNVRYMPVSMTFNNVPLQIVRVLISGKEQTKVNSISAVNAADKTWFYDRTTSTMYLNPKAGVEPNGCRVACFGIIPIANHVLHADGILHWPLITGGGENVQAKFDAQDQFFRLPAGATGNLTLNNANAALDALPATYELRGGRVTMRHKLIVDDGTDQSLATYSQFRKSYVGGFQRTDEELRLNFRSLTHKFKARALQLHYDSEADVEFPEQDAFPNMEKDQEGSAHQHVLGDFDEAAQNDLMGTWANGVTATLVNIGTPVPGGFINTEWKWSIYITDVITGDQHGVTPLSVLIKSSNGDIAKIPKITTLVKAGWQERLFGTVIQLLGGYVVRRTDQIRVTGLGLRDVAGRYTSSGGSIHLAPDLIRFYNAQAGIKDDEINTATYDACRGNPPWLEDQTINWTGHCKVFYDEQITFEDILDQLQQSIGVIQQEGTDGRLGLSFISPRITSTDPALVDADIADWEEELTDEYITTRIVMEHRPSPATGEFRKSKNKKTVKVLDGTNVLDNPGQSELGLEKEITIRCHLKKNSEAKLRANFLFNQFKKGNIKVSCTDLSGKLLGTKIGDRVIIDRSRAIGGSFNQKPFWVIGYGKDFGTGLTQLRLLEIAS